MVVAIITHVRDEKIVARQEQPGPAAVIASIVQDMLTQSKVGDRIAIQIQHD